MTTARTGEPTHHRVPRHPHRHDRSQLVRRAKRLAWLGNGWHVIEFAIAIGAGLAASSVALVAFGADSLIEALAGAVILWRFAGHRADSETAERHAQRLIAMSYLLLAVYVVVQATYALATQSHPETSWVGIGLACAAAASMPIIARAKWRLAADLGSRATAHEGSQNMLCAYLAIALLVGLLANAVLGWWWADPLTALVIAGLALNEGREAWRGEPDTCCAPVELAAVCGCGSECCGGLTGDRRVWRRTGQLEPSDQDVEAAADRLKRSRRRIVSKRPNRRHLRRKQNER